MMEAEDAANARSSRADFTFLQELGRGAWGTVLLARRLQDEQLYAVKTVELAMMSRKDQLAAVAEAQILSSLDSPHIVKYYDSYLHEGQLHIVMEYCAGGSLHAAIRRAHRPLDEDTIWRVLLHAALALQHMHSRRMLHRDVKTMNIFIADQLLGGRQHAQFKLGDVGVSKVLEEGRSHASTLIGTPYYLSPELVQELPYGPPSDMWALGVVLYECATRRHPFDAQSQASLIMKILRGRPEPVIGLSADLTSIIHRCLSQAAARRPSADGLLGLPCVRAKAAELGFELPAGVGSESTREGRRAPRMQLPPPGRRPTCPDTPPPEGEAAAATAAPQRRSSRAGAASLVAVPLAPAVPSPAHLPSVGERRKPPLPSAAVPLRRRTVQVDVARQGMLASPEVDPVAAMAGKAVTATVPEPALQTIVQHPMTAALAQAMLVDGGGAGSGLSGAAAPLASPASPLQPLRRHSHFSVQHHLDQMSAAARQWLAGQRSRSGGDGNASDGGCGGVESEKKAAEVQRSAKSDSSLLEMRASGSQGGGEGDHSAGGASPAAEAESPSAERPDKRRSTLLRLRQRCLALVGSDTLFEELYGLARAAVDADASGSADSGRSTSPRGGPGTLATFSDQLFQRLGYSRNAAEALHLLLKMMYFEDA